MRCKQREILKRPLHVEADGRTQPSQVRHHRPLQHAVDHKRRLGAVKNQQQIMPVVASLMSRRAAVLPTARNFHVTTMRRKQAETQGDDEREGRACHLLPAAQQQLLLFCVVTALHVDGRRARCAVPDVE